MRNTTKIGLVILTVLMAITLFTTPSGAAQAWYTCNVLGAGAGGTSSADGTVYIYLTDASGSFTKKWFTCLSGQENRMLAAALSAISQGKTVYVKADPSTLKLYVMVVLGS